MDEVQLAVNSSLLKYKISKDENEIKEFIKNWTGDKLSTIGHVNDNYYVVLPNVISKAISNAIIRAEKLLKLNVNLDMEWIAAQNWRDCH